MTRATGRLVLGGREWAPGNTVVMAVINRTPDSFFAPARGLDDDAARRQFEAAVTGGAEIVDIGGIRAGHGPEVSAAEEIGRVAPFLRWARDQDARVVLSVDTWRAEVARALAGEGADLINDTWAGADPQLLPAAAELGLGLVCSHTGGQRPRTDPHRVSYGAVSTAVVDQVAESLAAAAARAVTAGIPAESVLVDPTHDFGKNTRHGLLLLRHTRRLAALGHPLLMALSRKDFIGEALDLPDPAARLAGTLAASVHAAAHGAMVFRAHDVAATRQALDMLAMIEGRMPPRRSARGLA